MTHHYRIENERIIHTINTISENQQQGFKVLNLTIQALESLTTQSNAAYHEINKINRILAAITGDEST